jgi:hypothetical protein
MPEVVEAEAVRETDDRASGRARSTGLGPHLGHGGLRTWEESITARDQSTFFAARSFTLRGLFQWQRWWL